MAENGQVSSGGSTKRLSPAVKNNGNSPRKSTLIVNPCRTSLLMASHGVGGNQRSINSIHFPPGQPPVFQVEFFHMFWQACFEYVKKSLGNSRIFRSVIEDAYKMLSKLRFHHKMGWRVTMLDTSNKWPEHFPQQCPPKCAKNYRRIVYRCLEGDQPAEVDYLSFYEKETKMAY